VRRYHDKVDNMHRREYDKRHDRYEHHDSYDCHKRHHTSTEVTPSSSGGYAWPQAETPQIVVSPPQSPTPPCDTTSLLQAQSPAAPMEVDPDWPPLPPPGEHNQLNATMPQLPMISRHHALNERTTTYPMLPRGFHRSWVDNTVHMGAAAKAAQQKEAPGVVPPCKLKEWTYPDWFTPAPRKGKACAAPKKSECPLATSSGHLADGPTNLAATSAAKPQLPLFPELPPLHDDGWQPHHLEDVRLNMPKLRDTPEMWAMWIDQHPDKCPRGIVVMPDGHVPMHGICGMQLIKRRNP
jgi:hypothetical protein